LNNVKFNCSALAIKVGIQKEERKDMLCPEIWNFESPPHFTATLHLDMIKLKKSDVPTVVKNHYFNHSVNNFFQNLASLHDDILTIRTFYIQISVVLPDTVVPQNLYNCLLEDTDYYRINKLRVSDLLNMEFIEAFVKKGKFIIDLLLILFLLYTYLLISISIFVYLCTNCEIRCM